MTPRQRVALTIAAVIGGHGVLLLALFWRVWARGEMSGWDCVVEYWPDLVFQVRALGDGELPLWNPYALGGYPFWADPQTGLYHPASWLTWLLAAIGGTGPWLIQVKVMTNLLAGLCGMHAWMWTRTRSHVAAAVAAVVLVVGSPLLVHKNGALLWPVLYLPWALLALDRLLARPSARRGAAMAAALWLMGAAGHPQSFFYGLVILFLYGAFVVCAEMAPRLARLPRLAPGAAVAMALATLLLAATWVPARGAVDASPRAVRGPDYVLEVPIEPAQLDELLVPNVDDNWQHDVYVGPLALVGGLWLLAAARRRRQRAEAGLWLGIAAFGLLLALGREGYLLEWFAEHVPGFDLFRIAYRHKLIFGVAAAVLAGDAVGALVRGEATRTGRALWLWLGLAVAWLAMAASVELRAPAWPLAALVLAAAAAVGWLAAAGGAMRDQARAVAMLLPLLVVIDLWDAGAGKLAILKPRPAATVPAATLAALDGTDAHWRYHVGDAFPPDGGTVPYQAAFLADRREHSGYANPIEPARHAVIEAWALQWPELLLHFNVRYFAGHLLPPAGAREVAPGIVASDDAAPAVRWYGRAEVLTGDQILSRMTISRPGATAVAFVEEADVRGLALPASEGAPVAGRVVRFGRNTVTVEIDAPAAGIVVLAEAFAPGWEATVDGGPARVFRANYHLRAVVVPAGHSTVVFAYAPRGVTALLVSFALGLVGLAVAALGRWRWLDATAPEPVT